MGLVEYIHPSLVDVDYQKTSAKLTFISSSFIFFSCVYVVSHIFGSRTETYNKLRKKEKVFWNLAIVRATYGIFCIIVGIWAIFVDEELEKDVVFATTPTSYFALTISVGFFVFESLAVSISDIIYKQFSFMLNLHHWLSLFGFSILMVVESSHCIVTKGLILEMSTPFSAICWILLKAEKADTLLWKANQFVLVHTFHLRSVVECFIWYITVKHWDRIWETMPLLFFIVLYVQLTLLTFIMTPYWTYKKSQQMFFNVDWNFVEPSKTKTSNDAIGKKDI